MHSVVAKWVLRGVHLCLVHIVIGHELDGLFFDLFYLLFVRYRGV